MHLQNSHTHTYTYILYYIYHFHQLATNHNLYYNAYTKAGFSAIALIFSIFYIFFQGMYALYIEIVDNSSIVTSLLLMCS